MNTKTFALSLIAFMILTANLAHAGAGKRFSDSPCVAEYTACEEKNNFTAWQQRETNHGYSESAASLQCYTQLFVCKDQASDSFSGRPHVNAASVQDLDDAITDFEAKSEARTQVLQAYQAKVDAYLATLRAAAGKDPKSQAFYETAIKNLVDGEPQSAGLAQALTLVGPDSPALKKMVELKVKFEDTDAKLKQVTDETEKTKLTILRKSLEISALNLFNDFDDVIAAYFDSTNAKQFFDSPFVKYALLPIKDPCSGATGGFKGDLLQDGKVIAYILNGDAKSGIPPLSTKCSDKILGNIRADYSAKRNLITFHYGRRGGPINILNPNMDFDISRKTEFSRNDYQILDQIRAAANAH